MTRIALSALVLLAAVCRAEDIPRPEHPTPDAVRPHWSNLNGKWDFRFDATDVGNAERWFEPAAKGFDAKIVVPFGWESELSGIGKAKDAPKVGWYRRSFEVPKEFPKGDRVWLRFGAVDWRADVWVDGEKIGDHEGGYTPFEFDVTEKLKGDGPHTLVVRAFDPTDPSLPVGKQVGWYTTTSGIWQTVWLESRPKTFIHDFSVKTDFQNGQGVAEFVVRFPAHVTADYHLSITSTDATVEPSTGSSMRLVEEGNLKPGEMTTLTGTVRVRDPKPWTPESPHLYPITITLQPKQPDGPADVLTTYFGLRTVSRGKLPGEDFERILLNGKPIYLRGALDQSFNPKGIYTAPSDAFLKHDIELAKSVGTNFLRIHIKPDEPRRLYWADKLGMLIMEDMPNTWRQNDTARKAWESTMREVVARDKNHPSIFAWVDFNETWGLGDPPAYKKDKDTQAWVKQMVTRTRKLDPTRLVEDNSPCNYDHVAGSDLNSWHFYIDDHKSARSHIEDVVKRSTPGSAFNYCPDEKMNTSPLINSEYGSVSAGGGDRDVSWGFRGLTTQLRRHNKIQGYIYTELTDIEWEHNGFFDYDRGKKEFGYDAFVPDMTPKDLQGADFVGYDAPPAIEAKPGEKIRVPIFVSHYSDVKGQARINWWVKGVDGDGQVLDVVDQKGADTTREVEWPPNSVTEQKPIEFAVPKAFVGALGLELVDSEGKRLAANFVNIVVTPETPAPRVERRGDREAVIRFAPHDFASMKFTEGSDAPLGKVWGRGSGWLTYKLKIPASIVKAKPASFTVMFEAAAKNDRKQVDWPSRANAQDNPQTDERLNPSTLDVLLNGQKVERFKLPDDPADARGVLSHLRRIEHGGYGYHFTTDSTRFPASTLEDLNAGKPLVLTFLVFVDAADKNGLTLYGADAGAFPFDPTLVITTEANLPADLGVKPSETVAIDIAAARKVAILRAGDSNGGPPSVWSYTTTDPGESWLKDDFDASSWKRGPAGFGTPETPALQDKTLWDTPTIWLRTTVEAPAIGADDSLVLHLFHDEDVVIFVNGKPLFAEEGYVSKYRDIPLSDSARKLFHAGKNTIAVRCKQTGGGQGIDLGLTILRGE
jgi:Glycosyl hydrolases family 2, sugar binding domain/Glycosyl hydrolases family 2, TIM barrel domain/Glycosyl hydrolases family 2